MRSESCSFIWHPKVRIQKRLPVTAPSLRTAIGPGRGEAPPEGRFEHTSAGPFDPAPAN